MNWYNISNRIEDDSTTIYIDQEIGSYGISAKGFIDEVKSMNPAAIHLVINSGGGSVFDALAIYDFLTTSRFRVTVEIQGLAASAATIIALAGDARPVMTANSFFMIHNPFITMGDLDVFEANDLREYAKDMENTADLLDRITEKLVNIYADATGLNKVDIKQMMDNTTWMDAQQALELGFLSDVKMGAKVAAFTSVDELAKKGYKNIPENYVNKLNFLNMSDNKKSLLERFEAFLKGEEVSNEVENTEATTEQPVEETVNENAELEALKAELEAAKEALAAKDNEVAELTESFEAKAKSIEASFASKFDEVVAKVEKATAKRVEVAPSNDEVAEEVKAVSKSPVGDFILNMLEQKGLRKSR